MSAKLRTLFLSVVAATGACAHAGGPDHAAAPRTVSVVVDNQYQEDVRVYLVRGDTPILLGSVGSFRSRTFRPGPALLPRLVDIRLRVRAADGSVFNAPAVMADAGERVLWYLGPRLKLSSISVR